MKSARLELLTKVIDKEINTLAKQLTEKTGRHVFHSKINWATPTPYVKVK